MITIKEVTEIEKEKVEEFTKDEWKKFNKENGYEWKDERYTFVAYDNRKIVGFARFKINGDVAYLSELITAKATRRKGIGTLLLKKFEEFSISKDCHAAYFETSEKHKDALEFYKKKGYKIITTLPNHRFHATWYFMWKELK